MSRVCVIDLPGMSRELLEHVPPASALGKWLGGQRVTALTPSWPAVTCSVQATLTTGIPPARHGIVANGIPTFRSTTDAALIDPSSFASHRREVSFWEQSNQFVQHRRFWQGEAGQSRYKTALLFFQHSMPGFASPLRPAADIVITPKPEHGPDGKFTSLCWSEPRDLIDTLTKEIGPFPLMNYWGPLAGIASSTWIVNAAVSVWQRHQPQLQLVYVPHLDYDLQRFGTNSAEAAKAVEDVSRALDPLVDAVSQIRGRLLLISEYSMREVGTAISPNRLLAEAGLLVTRDTPDGKLVDYHRSTAFAMVDHQIAHLYARDPQALPQIHEILSPQPLSIRDGDWMREAGMNHPRSGDLFLQAHDHAWFDYRWWSDTGDAPAFARSVDIHRKPGFDPMELFWDPALEGISQDTSRLRGSHGIACTGEAILAGHPEAVSTLHATEVAPILDNMIP